MNWIRENTFLSGLLFVVIGGGAALAVMVFLASGQYGEVSADYDKQVTELQRLEGLKPYPNTENLARANEEKEAYVDTVNMVRNRISELGFPLEESTPSQFQDVLRQAVGDVRVAAKDNEVELQEEFYLGFDVYQSEPPKEQAAGPLARELKSVKMLADILIQAGVDELSIERLPLVEEGASVAASKAKSTKSSRAKNAGNKEVGLVAKHPVILNFRSDPRVFQAVMNRIAGAEKFFVIRTLNVQNEVPAGPSRGATVQASRNDQPRGAGNPPQMQSPNMDQAGVGGAFAASGTDGRMEFVVGSEKLQVSLRVEIVDFVPAENKLNSTPTGA